MMNNRGEIAVSKVIMIVMVLLLLGITIPMFASENFALNEKFMTVKDSVLLLLNRNSGEYAADCRLSEVIVVGDVAGKMVICSDNRTFEIGEDTLLDANEFHLTSQGYKASFQGVSHLINVNSWGNDYEDSVRDKEAYDGLKLVFDGFYDEYSDEYSREELNAIMDFDPYSYLTIVVGDMDSYTEYNVPGVNSAIADWMTYYFDGKEWKKSFGDNIISISDKEAFSEIYNSYSYGTDVVWKYFNEKKYKLPLSNKEDSSVEDYFDEIAFSSWLEAKIVFMDSKSKIPGTDKIPESFNLKIGDYPNLNEYFYKNSKWKKNRLLWFNARVDRDEIFKEMMEAVFKKSTVVWNFDTDDKNAWRLPVSDERVDLRATEGEFKDWFDFMVDNFVKRSEQQQEFFENYFVYFDSDLTVYFEGSTYEVFVVDQRNDDSEGASKLLLYFDVVESYEGATLSSVERGNIISDKDGNTYEAVYSSLNKNQWRIDMLGDDGYRSISGHPNSYLRDYEDFDYSIVYSSKYDVGADRFGMYVDSGGFCDGLLLADLNYGDIISDKDGNDFEVTWISERENRRITLTSKSGDERIIEGSRYILLSEYGDFGYVEKSISGNFCKGFESSYVLTHGEDYKDSLIKDELTFDDYDWQEFLSINKIYEELRDA